MPVVVEMFPDSFIALQQEVLNHPRLLETLRVTRTTTQQLPEFLATVATYCNVLVEGQFGDEELDSLCDLLVTKLKQRSSIFILP